MKNNVLDEVKRFFRPEFLNRIDGTVVFHSLNREHMEQIVDLMLTEVSSSLIERGISLEITDEAKEWLSEHGFDPKFGARPLRRVIQDNVEDRLSDAILAGDLNPADTALIDVDEDEIVVRAQSPVPLTPA
jgi:ATP-dependent Clp protease ATP-binding subunit ClpC